MFEYMQGKLVDVNPLYIVVDVQGVGYQIFAANPYRFSSLLNQEIKVYIYQAVRDDGIKLYGFRDEYEKNLYIKLISVSGIGPKSGLSIMANDDYAGLIRAIETENVTYLTKFPGVGKKTASQIILDLKGKLTDLLDDHSLDLDGDREESQAPNQNRYIVETEEALKGLGYSVRDVNRIMPKLKEESGITSTEDALRIAFKLLLNN